MMRRLLSSPAQPSYDVEQIALVMALRGAGITNIAVLNAIESVPRGLFVPAELAAFSRAGQTLPIGTHETISDPIVVAKMTEALQITKTSRVLEIGTGSGYQTAILARLGRMVYSIERNARLLYRARERLDGLGINNIELRLGDGALGWGDHAPFHRILLTAACEAPPPHLWQQLISGGKMALPLGQGGERIAQITLLTKSGTEIGAVDPIVQAPFVPLRPGFTSG